MKTSFFLRQAALNRVQNKCWRKRVDLLFHTVHVDLLTQFDELHLSGHVSHGSHAVPQVFAANDAVFVFIKLFEGFSQLCEDRNQVRKNRGQSELEIMKREYFTEQLCNKLLCSAFKTIWKTITKLLQSPSASLNDQNTCNGIIHPKPFLFTMK